MVQSATAAGAAFLPGTYATLAGIRARTVSDGSDRIVLLRQGAREWPAAARIVVAADGLGGRLLAGEPGLRTVTTWNSRIGAGVVLPGGPDFYEQGTIYMACAAEGYLGLVRLEDGRLDVAAAFDRKAVQCAGGPAQLSAEILRTVGWPLPFGARSVTDGTTPAWRGTPALTRRATRVAAEGLFVVGDSAGYVEPFTGEGIAWALEAAVALAPLVVEAVRQWTPRLAARWTSVLRRTVGRRRTCRAAAGLLRHPYLTRGVIGLLNRFPSLGRPVLNRLNRPLMQKAAHS
jgi:2-polyprenyl-6-methoxyphenol hydroxylase-like FAD-dependent oxidoreductase